MMNGLVKLEAYGKLRDDLKVCVNMAIRLQLSDK